MGKEFNLMEEIHNTQCLDHLSANIIKINKTRREINRV